VRTESAVIFLGVANLPAALPSRAIDLVACGETGPMVVGPPRRRSPYGGRVSRHVDQRPPGSAGSDEVPRGFRLAAALLAVQVLAILGFSGFYLVELALGAEANATQTVMSVVTFLVGAAALAVVARGLFRGAGWARTPSVLWNVLVLLIAVSLAQSGQLPWSLAVGAVAVGGIVGVLAAGRTARHQSGATAGHDGSPAR